MNLIRWASDTHPGEGAKQVALVWLARAMRSIECYDDMLASEARALSSDIEKLYVDLLADSLKSWKDSKAQETNINAVRLKAPNGVIALPGVTSDADPSHMSMFELLGMAENAMTHLALLQKTCFFRWPVAEEGPTRG